MANYVGLIALLMQQENDPKHTDKATRGNHSVMCHPGCVSLSADFTPADHVLHIVKSRVIAHFSYQSQKVHLNYSFDCVVLGFFLIYIFNIF